MSTVDSATERAERDRQAARRASLQLHIMWLYVGAACANGLIVSLLLLTGWAK